MNDPHQTRPWLTPGQRQLTALALCTLAGLVLLLVAALVIWGLRVFIAVFGHVIWPLVIASILAVLLRPVVNSLQRKLKLPRVRAILLLYFFVVAACLALGLLLLPLIASQVVELSHTAPDLIKRGILRIKEILREYPDINQAVKSYLDEKGLLAQVNEANQHLFGLLMSAPSTFRALLDYSAGVAVIPIYLFYLLETDRNFSRAFREELTFLPAAVREDIVFLSSEFAGIMVSFFHGRLLIGLVMGVMQALGFFAIGLQGGFVLGLFFGLLNLVPFLGMILGVAVVLPIAYIQTGGG
ncbi:MAG TPA: AI-2E family transporter, partial [Opitutales bacterium]|nr:AI-2E family transporter [Opitutales bacterium]